ncbi:MAG TPA: hypothetical protein PLN72_06840, partial [bacterium]|nr:hypothetical protein [bacterium]HPM59276.1 hypothetical protein [bacterium]
RTNPAPTRPVAPVMAIFIVRSALLCVPLQLSCLPPPAILIKYTEFQVREQEKNAALGKKALTQIPFYCIIV